MRAACMAGRAYLYGLGAAGERGVDHVLALFAEDMRRTMALVGVRAIDELGPEFVDRGVRRCRQPRSSAVGEAILACCVPVLPTDDERGGRRALYERGVSSRREAIPADTAPTPVTREKGDFTQMG